MMYLSKGILNLKRGSGYFAITNSSYSVGVLMAIGVVDVAAWITDGVSFCLYRGAILNKRTRQQIQRENKFPKQPCAIIDTAGDYRQYENYCNTQNSGKDMQLIPSAPSFSLINGSFHLCYNPCHDFSHRRNGIYRTRPRSSTLRNWTTSPRAFAAFATIAAPAERRSGGGSGRQLE